MLHKHVFVIALFLNIPLLLHGAAKQESPMHWDFHTENNLKECFDHFSIGHTLSVKDHAFCNQSKGVFTVTAVEPTYKKNSHWWVLVEGPHMQRYEKTKKFERPYWTLLGYPLLTEYGTITHVKPVTPKAFEAGHDIELKKRPRLIENPTTLDRAIIIGTTCAVLTGLTHWLGFWGKNK